MSEGTKVTTKLLVTAAVFVGAILFIGGIFWPFILGGLAFWGYGKYVEK